MSATRKRALVVGVGSIGERHVRCFQATERVDVAICEPNTELRDAIADRYSISDTCASIDAALKEKFDLAVIATPAPLHVPQATLLAQSGTHVLIEKPLSVTAAGIDALQKLATGTDVTVAVAFPYRAHPALAAMRDCVCSGELARPLQVTVVAGQNFPTYRPAYRNTYYSRRATGGGAIQDALSHVINAVEWLVGPTTAVAGDAERLKLDGVEVEDTCHVLARNGHVMTAYSLNQHQPANELSLTVACERGQARFEGHNASWSKLTEVDGKWEYQTFDDLGRDIVFRNQANAFLDAVEGRSLPLCNLAEGYGTLKTVIAILASLESRRWEAVDTLTETSA